MRYLKINIPDDMTGLSELVTYFDSTSATLAALSACLPAESTAISDERCGSDVFSARKHDAITPVLRDLAASTAAD